ncbi:MAG TPA: selenide, water dikinase SelD [Acidimicrobiales bacterium]|nr:selenide, water dikinase SelD [Acidimicrobiales bacterium]
MTEVDIESFKLTDWTTCGGCAAKWSATALAELRDQIRPRSAIGDILVGLDEFDDAAVVRVSDGLALVSTIDFFPPLVDSPDDYGAIAAANACSDVFAMGGRVIVALNIAAFPEDLPMNVVAAIQSAASEMVDRAGGIVAGGHTIRSAEPIFGLAVQGLVEPDRILTKGGAQPGDALLLSKPIGTGIIMAGGTEDSRRAAVTGMRRLNDGASSALQQLSTLVHAVTDVTGFGLAGHAWEMAERSGLLFHIDMSGVPLYPGALDAASAGIRTGGDQQNRDHLRGHVVSSVDAAYERLVFDPQTSGGLLAAVAPEAVEELMDQGYWVIGWVSNGAASVSLVP